MFTVEEAPMASRSRDVAKSIEDLGMIVVEVLRKKNVKLSRNQNECLRLSRASKKPMPRVKVVAEKELKGSSLTHSAWYIHNLLYEWRTCSQTIKSWSGGTGKVSLLL